MPAIGAVRKSLAIAILACVALSVSAAEPPKGLEEAINSALASKRGVTLYVNGQTLSGAVTKVEPGQFVELRNQEFGRIVVRWDRVDGIAMP